MSADLRYLDDAKTEYAFRLFRSGRDTLTIAQVISSRYHEVITEAMVYNSLHKARAQGERAA